MLRIAPQALAAALFALSGAGCASAQANGDPGAAMSGQLAARRAERKQATDHPGQGPKSGANAMPAGSGGGAGGAGMTGGSNAMSGSAHAPPSR